MIIFTPMDNFPKNGFDEQILRLISYVSQKIQGTEIEDLSPIDQIALLPYIKTHRLVGFVYSNRLAPELIFQRKRQIKRTFSLIKEIHDIELFLASESIDHVFLKGPLLSHVYYNDITVRTSKDIDVLIQSKDFLKADEYLLNNGYQKSENYSNLTSDQLHLLFKSGNEVEYFHPQTGVQVEVHWRLFRNKSLFSKKMDLIFRSKEFVTFKNVKYPVLGEEDLFLYLCIHGGRHGWLRIQWLIDIFYIHQQSESIALIKMYEDAKKEDLHLYVLQPFVLMAKLFSIEIPKEIKAKCVEHEKSLIPLTDYVIDGIKKNKAKTLNLGMPHLKYQLKFRRRWSDILYHIFHIPASEIKSIKSKRSLWLKLALRPFFILKRRKP
jgi:hypothetical protein